LQLRKFGLWLSAQCLLNSPFDPLPNLQGIVFATPQTASKVDAALQKYKDALEGAHTGELHV
jgi:hypothetical protein